MHGVELPLLLASALVFLRSLVNFYSKHAKLAAVGKPFTYERDRGISRPGNRNLFTGRQHRGPRGVRFDGRLPGDGEELAVGQMVDASNAEWLTIDGVAHVGANDAA